MHEIDSVQSLFSWRRLVRVSAVTMMVGKLMRTSPWRILKNTVASLMQRLICSE